MKKHKKSKKNLVESKKSYNFAVAFVKKHGPLAQLNRVSDYGSEGCRFESCMGHKTGVLAHLVERNNGIVEVRSSSLLCSTSAMRRFYFNFRGISSSGRA